MQRTGRWSAAGDALARAAVAVEGAGADFLVLCTNTMHKVASTVERAVRTPLLHIADPTAEAIRQAGLRTVGLLGTRFTMEESFYRDRLRERHGIDVVVPGEDDRTAVHRIIYDELCMGRVVDASRATFARTIERLVDRGAEGIVLGCTEISLLVGASDAPVPVFDTTLLHARAAAIHAMNP
jgi:aspartate racemase